MFEAMEFASCWWEILNTDLQCFLVNLTVCPARHLIRYRSGHTPLSIDLDNTTSGHRLHGTDTWDKIYQNSVMSYG